MAAALEYLTDQGLDVQAVGDRLRVGPPERLTDAHREFITQHKAQILVALKPSPLEGLPMLWDDKVFVHQHTQERTDQHALLQEYRRRWLEASEAEPLAHKQANRGRYAANIWLLGATETKGGCPTRI